MFFGILLFVFALQVKTASFCQSSSCLPCHYTCASCTNSLYNNCLQCSKNYFLDASKSQCKPCGLNCKLCFSVDKCDTCQQGYYLSQATGICHKCPVGAAKCTLSAIQSCKPGYYYQSGQCLSCIENCGQCDSGTSCQICSQNYFVNNEAICSKCSNTQCSSCLSNGQCSNCVSGFTGSDCSQPCDMNCITCHQGICYECSPTYFLNSILNKCLSMSILCKSTSMIGNEYPFGCSECASYAYQQPQNITQCLPRYTVEDYNIQKYINSTNQYNSLLVNDNKTVQLLNCSSIGLFYLWSNKLGFKLNLDPLYLLESKVQVALQIQQLLTALETNWQINSNSIQQFDIIIYSSSIFFKKQAQTAILTNFTYSKFKELHQYSCSNGKIYIQNAQSQSNITNSFNFLVSNFQVSFTLSIKRISTNQTIALNFGITQILFSQKRCRIDNCLKCSSAFKCSACIPPLKLQYTQCVQQCSYGLYYTVYDSLQLCSIDCTKGFYPILDQYICVQCQASCYTCQSLTKCLSCVDDYFLKISSNQTQQCTKDCGNGYYSQKYLLSDQQIAYQATITMISRKYNGQCKKCIYPCQNCISETQCTSCVIGYFHNATKKCYITCPSGTFSDFVTLQCKNCSVNCQTCSGNANNCQTCPSGQILDMSLTQYICKSTCPPETSKQFVNNIYICLLCQYPCLQCLDYFPSKCKSCKVGFYIETLVQNLVTSGQCLLECPVGTYANNLTLQCLKCIEPCQTCQNISFCESCLNNFSYYQNNGSCLTFCPQGYYESIAQDKSVCLKCIPPCQTCQSQTQCLSCTASLFLLYNKKCYLNCPYPNTILTFKQNVFSGLAERRCSLCSQILTDCLQCSSVVMCIRCNQTLLYNGNCFSECPNNTFPMIQQSNNYCQLCIFPCSKCINYTVCTQCELGYWLQNGICRLYCDNSYYYQNITIGAGNCMKCLPQCQLCNNLTSDCLLCRKNSYKNASKICVSQCQPGTFASDFDRQCHICRQPCLQCVSQYSCLKCNTTTFNNILSQFNITLPEFAENYTNIQINYPFFYKHHCLSSCPQKYYPKLASNNHDYICIQCPNSCQACYSEQICGSCQPGYYLFKNNSIKGKCLNLCYDGYFKSIVRGQAICTQCSSNCLTCEGEQTLCTSCGTGYILKNYFCTSDCGIGYFLSSQNNSSTCLICDQECLTCNQTAIKCLSCSAPLYLNKVNNYCVQQCPEGYYKDNNTNSCQQCLYPCLQCQNSRYCVSCNQSGGQAFYLYHQQCLISCPQGYYSGNGLCQICTNGCKACSSITTCLSCIYGKFLNRTNNNCQQNCSEGYYPYAIYALNDGGQCLQCPSYCLTCKDYNKCTSCNQSSNRAYLQNGKCISSCSISYFSDSINPFSCQPCSKNCIRCFNTTYCIQCYSSYQYNGVCSSSCPNQYYQDHSLSQCVHCQSPCQTCYDSINCKTCISNYYLYLKFCLKHCPENMWGFQQTRICIEQCPQNYFKDQLNKLCLKSCPKFYDSQAFCVDSCPSFINKTLGCSDCTQAHLCSQRLYYKIIGLQKDGNLFLVLSFSQKLDDPNKFSVDQFKLTVKQKVMSKTEVDIVLFNRVLQTEKQIQGLTITQRTQQQIWVKVQLEHKEQPYVISGEGQLQQLLRTTYNSYPTQNPTYSFQPTTYFNQNNSSIYAWLQYIGLAISVIVGLMFICNLFLDNFRACIWCIETFQSVYLLLYINVWYHPALESFLYGLRFISFRAELFPTQWFSNYVWFSTAKQIRYLTDCGFFRNIGLVVVALCIFIVVVSFGKLFYSQVYKPSKILQENVEAQQEGGQQSNNKKITKKEKHKFFWSHFNDLYWLVSYPLIVGALTACRKFDQIVSYDIIQQIVAILIFIIAILASLVLFYQIIKNIFNGSFEERTFFWALKKWKNDNPITNCHILMLLIRRWILACFIGLYSFRNTAGLFLILLVSVVMLSNIVLNQPFKIYPILLPIAEVTYGLIILLLLVYVVNVSSFNYIGWTIMNWIILSLIILLFLLHIIILVLETIKSIKKFRGSSNKVANTNQQQEDDRQTSSNATQAKIATQILKMDIQEKENQLPFPIPLNEEFSRKSQNQKQDESQIISQWSELSKCNLPKPASFLIRYDKASFPSLQKSEENQSNNS